MSKYKITIVESAVYDVYVEADSLEEAKDKAHDTEPSKWVKDDDASYCELGTDHFVWVDNDWKETKQ